MINDQITQKSDCQCLAADVQVCMIQKVTLNLPVLFLFWESYLLFYSLLISVLP